MGWLSTYTQTVSANSINGKPLKEAFLESGIVKDGKFKLFGIKGTCPNDMFVDYAAGNFDTTCFTKEQDGVSVIFDCGENDNFISRQLDSVKLLSEAYPDSTFHLHSSYCAGGCGERLTALDVYFKDGEDLSVCYLLNVRFCAGSDAPEDVDTGLFLLKTPSEVSEEEIKKAFRVANALCSPYEDEDYPGFPVSYSQGLNIETFIQGIEVYTGWTFEKVNPGKSNIKAAAYYEIEQWQ